ncbi:hypothetical protein FRX31_025765 [Thalictrum thalictroides]|uniref:Uncharacterized protein n=1 Tax=Thalictrum thalictroides TaxID=46969 RepID=A0A7J6VIR8_THATH|nr:hypothetical protein FRX31_025765 [Thalictrum thalictroides]
MKNLKRFKGLGCPGNKNLEVTFGDTATGHLQVNENHDFNSTDGEDSPNEVTVETLEPPHLDNLKVMNEHDNVSTQSKSQTQSRKRGRNQPKGPDLSEEVFKLAEASQARMEARRKFTIMECQDVLEAMDVDVGRLTYVKLMTLFQKKGWREAFLHIEKEEQQQQQ